MKHLMRRLSLVATLLVPAVAAHAVESGLYETGPAEDSSFIRFVDGSGRDVSVGAAGSSTQLNLNAEKPASDFFPVRAGQALKGEIRQGAQTLPVSTTVQPGEFASVIVLNGEQGVTTRTLVEAPDDFNALKASIAFYNLDPACASASLNVAGRSAVLFADVKTDVVPERRQVNPVELSLQLACDGKPTGETLEFGKLRAGERYTIFIVPAPAKGARLFQAVDSVAF